MITDGEMINRYGITNVGKLALREQPNKKGRELTRLDRGVHVYMYRADQNSAGESWTYVEANGRRGYIKTEFLDPLTQEDSDAWDNSQPTRVPVLTEEELFPRTEEPAAEPAPASEPEPAAEPAPAAEPEPAAEPAPAAEPEPAAEPACSRCRTGTCRGACSCC